MVLLHLISLLAMDFIKLFQVELALPLRVEVTCCLSRSQSEGDCRRFCVVVFFSKQWRRTCKIFVLVA